MITLSSAVYGAIGILCFGLGALHLLPAVFARVHPWRWWAFGIAVVGGLFTLSVAVQFTAGQGALNLYADRIAFAALSIHVYLLIGFAQSFSSTRLRWLLIGGAPIHLAIVVLSVATNLISPAVYDFMPSGFGEGYWETVAGPAQPIVMAVLFVECGLLVAASFRTQPLSRLGSILARTGISIWFAMAVADALTSLNLISLPPLMSIGFFGFALTLLVAAFLGTREAERRIRDSEARSDAILAASPHPIVALDESDTVAFANEAFVLAFGSNSDSVVGRRAEDLFGGESSRLRRAMNRARATGRIQSVELDIEPASGGARHLHCTAAPWARVGEERNAIVLNLTDVTERVLQAERSEYLATHDSLTGLLNRSSLNNRLSELIDDGERNVRAPSWAVLFLDLDKFKPINDTLGHHIGDQVLIEVGRRITEVVPRRDLCFRLGGDEFVIVVPGLAEDLDALTVSNKVERRLREELKLGAHSLHIRVSIGVTVHPRDGKTVADVLRNADIAMYEAKESGESIRFFTEDINTRALDLMQIEMGLQTAVSRNELTLHYQPIVDENRNVKHVEALIRWIRPGLGMTSPAQFIPIAEKTGHIVEIGEWVLQRAFRDLSTIHAALGPVGVSVNVSPVQIRRSDMVERIAILAREFRVDPKYVTIELTETVLVSNIDVVAERIAALRDQGFSVAIDDFGTGYSSLSYLNTLPIDKVKFDRSLLLASEGASTLTSLIRLVSDIGLKCVVEGVETEEQRTSLVSTPAVLQQGYLYSKPVPVDEIGGAGPVAATV